jgi:hypothetical protein
MNRYGQGHGQEKNRKPILSVPVLVTLVVVFIFACGGLMGCKANKAGEPVNITITESDTNKDSDSEKSLNNVYEPKVTDFVWKVEPVLEYKKIHCCMCGFIGEDSYLGKGIDPKTGSINNSEHYGHGGGTTYYLYDEGKGLFGYYSFDEGGEYFEMLPGNEFMSNVWGAGRIKAFQKIDSDKVTKYKNEWGEDSFDLTGAYVSDKYAAAYGKTLLSAFIYDYCKDGEEWDYSNYNANNIIALILEGKWGIIDKNGNNVVPFCFEDIVLIDEKTAFAKIDGKYGILNIFGLPLNEDEIFPFGGEVFVTNFSDKNIFIRSEPEISGESSKMNDGNKIGWIEKGDESVELIATGYEYHEGDDGHWWYEIEIPQWYRDTPKQAENFAGKPLIGWVRDDIVRQIR